MVTPVAPRTVNDVSYVTNDKAVQVVILRGRRSIW